MSYIQYLLKKIVDRKLLINKKLLFKNLKSSYRGYIYSN